MSLPPLLLLLHSLFLILSLYFTFIIIIIHSVQSTHLSFLLASSSSQYITSVLRLLKMTQQNVVVCETKSAGINTVAQKPPTVPGGYIPIPRRRVLKNLEINGGGQRINAWIDSMRASSPTHVKSTPSMSLADEYTSWIVRTHYSPSLFYTLIYFLVNKQNHTNNGFN